MKLVVNAPVGVMEIIEVGEGGGYFDPALVLWDERTQGTIPAELLTAVLASQAASAAAPKPTDWLIDVGPFFDRFGEAKMPLLMSTHATVQALVKDLQVRKWIDLQRPDVGAGIDALIAIGVPGMTAGLKTSILTTPVTPEENFALRRVYFS
jgi:hypothetical protein